MKNYVNKKWIYLMHNKQEKKLINLENNKLKLEENKSNLNKSHK
jgi:hypothetical protein